MSKTISANKRIAKNTLFLYMRMLVVMAVSLYTSRVVLATLGVTDYGLYNVVGSIVTMFIFIRSAMGNVTNRYIQFALGKGDEENLKKVFSTLLIVHAIIALFIILLCETIGLWLLYNKMVIPPGRMNAAFWAFQFSVFTCALGVMCVPYDADIIAHEKMGAFAYMSFFDVTMKLLIVFLLAQLDYDKLIMYGALLFVVQVINRIIYGWYCKKHFKESHSKFIWDIKLIKELFSSASWNLVGNMAALGCTPILNIFLNMFFGPAINAARGVAVQVQGAVKGFVYNFQLASFPQITKSFAIGDLDRMNTLIIAISKFSYCLFLCLALPLCIEAKQVLALWLVDVPEHTVSFMRLVLFIMVLNAWELPLHTANLATGKLKLFQSVKGITLFMMVPLAYIALKLGAPAESVFVVEFFVTLASILIQLKIISPMISLPKRGYLKNVFGRSLLVTILSLPLPIFIANCLTDNIVNTFIIMFFTVLSVLIATYLLGLESHERKIANRKFVVFLHKISTFVQR